MAQPEPGLQSPIHLRDAEEPKISAHNTIVLPTSSPLSEIFVPPQSKTQDPGQIGRLPTQDQTEVFSNSPEESPYPAATSPGSQVAIEKSNIDPRSPVYKNGNDQTSLDNLLTTAIATPHTPRVEIILGSEESSPVIEKVWEVPSRETVFPFVDDVCPEKKNHHQGEICSTCRGICMPWGKTIPVMSHDDIEVTVGPPDTVVEGVPLDNEEAIAVMAMVAALDMNNRQYHTLAGFPDIMDKYPESILAGQRVSDLHRTLRRIAGPQHTIPRIHIVVHVILCFPYYTWDSYGNSAMRHMAMEAPVRKETLVRASFLKEGADHYHEDRDNYSEKEDEGDTLIFEERNIPMMNSKWKKPGAQGVTWEFVAGTDISKAEVGVPDPSKLFLVRQNVKDETVKDVRQYPGWATMDWNDPKSIEELNKARTQIRSRTSGLIAVAHPPWTLAEKEILTKILRTALSTGLNRSTLDWDKVAIALQDYFSDKIQQKGSPLAQTTTLSKDGVVGEPRYKHNKKLKEDRVGSVKRLAATVKVQAMKYGDVALMLRTSKPIGKATGVRGPYKKNGRKVVDPKETVDEEQGEMQSRRKGTAGLKRKRSQGLENSALQEHEMQERSRSLEASVPRSSEMDGRSPSAVDTIVVYPGLM